MIYKRNKRKQYWEQRYASGGKSGIGSIGEIAKTKWTIIKQYFNNINDVIDVACGDLSF